ncbi:5-(carboxyamino)imidazole ribonucleotide synthase [Ramlibacter tataouinensis]|uniref:N5-carboxyaminoimidazole ribonucleotide synthase n=1 Tax=Ramlibacter tataouinensis (strain ATCC BAA-407 / DSM 14655 / LMG 21543 / TTB310) TaxID=365046 RepID=F5Y222_RAMTT|nr:5-(carboxyamino)imidazole ribonucleotide synthase [Ramlibacter tataouinensis]AEG94790.1 Candidate phosphoribosylaminoimidazole carboxylase ATPase subunit [Ramlibacter tataouinensis TTB310]
MILPGATLGVMGGGQLGRMFVHAAQRLGYFTAVLDPDADSPAGRVSHHHVRSAYLDEAGLAELARLSAAVTTEFENVPAQALGRLAALRPVAPGAEAVAIAQDRAREKAHFTRCGVPCAPHAMIEDEAQLAAVPDALLPGVLKTARLGYDGKGQVRVATRAELAAAWEGLQRVPCVLEQLLPLAAECSVVVARGADGRMAHLPVQRNLHRAGILAVTEVHPGNLPADRGRQAIEATQAIADGLGYVGVLCVEFFVLQDGSLVVNEMAPRPHNSGHWSLDAADASQFELQVRALAGLPLVQPRQHSPAIMLNLLGDLWFRGGAETAREPDWAGVLALPGAHLHLYGKTEARPGRKMGHLTLTGAGIESVRAAAWQACDLLGIERFQGPAEAG